MIKMNHFGKVFKSACPPHSENKKGGREGVLCHRTRIIWSLSTRRQEGEGVGGETKDRMYGKRKKKKGKQVGSMEQPALEGFDLESAFNDLMI